MPKTKISEYSTTNADNTDIEGINIAEGCAPSGINNAIREIMVHLKEFQTGASGDGFTFAGGTLMTGTNTLSGTNVLSGSTTAAFAAGTVSAPSIAAHGDTNTGIFFPAADTIAFAEGGAEAMRIDSSGNVGIGGTAESGYKLDVTQSVNDSLISRVINTSSGSLASARIYAQNNDASVGQLATYGSGFGFNLFGTSAANWTSLISSGSNSNGLKIGTTTSDPIVFGTAGAEVMRIDSSGNVGIGTTSPEQKLNIKDGKLQFNGATVASGFSNSSIAIRGSQNIADDATVSPAVANSSLIYVSENNNGTGALFFATYSSGTVVKLADPSNIFDVADTDGKVCVFKSSSTGTYTVKNRRGSTLSFTISSVSVSD